MGFDPDRTLKEMLGAMQGVVTQKWPEVEQFVQKAIENEREALVQIADMRLTGDLTDAEMEQELANQADILEAELLAAQVMTKAMAQRAVGEALGVLRKAVRAAL